MPLPHRNELCYVASGLQFAKFLMKEALEDRDAVELTAKWIKRIDNVHSHRFSVLFNAFTEKKFGPKIQETMKESVYDIHADSGGLQMISRGFNVTDADKLQIYETQSKYSDVAMSFDEIPVYTLVARSELKDASNKVFDRSRLEPCARETARNITTQIQYFLDNKTKTRPLAIIQGNCLETAMIWTDVLFKEIPKSMHEVIGGVAIGSPALGVGELEEVKKAFWFTQIPFDIKEKHLHMLGVGAIKRMIPTIVFLKSGLISDTFVSYDSTTHTSMNTFGRYCFGVDKPYKDQIVYTRAFDENYVNVYNDIVALFPELKEYVRDAKQFHEVSNISVTAYKEKYGTGLPCILATNAHALSSIYNFMGQVERGVEDFSSLHSYIDHGMRKCPKTGFKGIDTKKRNVYAELAKVKTVDDYKYWEAHLGRFLESKPSRNGNTTLDEFFV
jgi:hypothetical protein